MEFFKRVILKYKCLLLPFCTIAAGLNLSCSGGDFSSEKKSLRSPQEKKEADDRSSSQDQVIDEPQDITGTYLSQCGPANYYLSRFKQSEGMSAYGCRVEKNRSLVPEAKVIEISIVVGAWSVSPSEVIELDPLENHWHVVFLTESSNVGRISEITLLSRIGDVEVSIKSSSIDSIQSKTPVSDAEINGLVAFTSSGSFEGDIKIGSTSGLAAADSECQRLSKSVGLLRDYQAYLLVSDNGFRYSSIDSLPLFNLRGQLVNPLGLKALGVSEPSLKNTIIYTERNLKSSFGWIWIGSNLVTKSAASCEGFSTQVATGISLHSELFSFTTRQCSQKAHLLCISIVP